MNTFTRAFLLASLACASLVCATDYTKTTTIGKVDALGTGKQGFGANTVRVYVPSGAWSPSASSGCSETRLYILKADTHLLTTVYMAMSLRKGVTVTVDNGFPVMDDACQIVSVAIDN